MSSLFLCSRKKIAKYMPGGPGLVAQSLICLTATMCQAADPWVTSSIPVRSHTFLEIIEYILWTFSSISLLQEGLLSVTSETVCTKYWLTT